MDYSFKIEWPRPKEQCKPEHEAVEVILQYQGAKYSINIVTLRFLPAHFKKNKVTGECANGTYFGMAQNWLALEEINEDTVKRTLDDLIEQGRLGSFLTEV